MKTKGFGLRPVIVCEQRPRKQSKNNYERTKEILELRDKEQDLSFPFVL